MPTHKDDDVDEKSDEKPDAKADAKKTAADAKPFTMKYIGTVQDRLTPGTTYHVIDWLVANGQHVSALVFADDGGLYVALEMQNQAEWEVVREGVKKDKATSHKA
jgi:hypothetical protein